MPCTGGSNLILIIIILHSSMLTLRKIRNEKQITGAPFIIPDMQLSCELENF